MVRLGIWLEARVVSEGSRQMIGTTPPAIGTRRRGQGSNPSDTGAPHAGLLSVAKTFALRIG